MRCIKRFGSVIELNSERLEQYMLLHHEKNPGVRDLLTKYNFNNFSIYLKEFDDGKMYLFCYYEYTGDNFEEDSKAMDAEPRIKEWYKLSDPCLIPYKEESRWSKMQEVYHNK